MFRRQLSLYVPDRLGRSRPENLTITFDTICLIEQEGQRPWRVLHSFSLAFPRKTTGAASASNGSGGRLRTGRFSR